MLNALFRSCVCLESLAYGFNESHKQQSYVNVGQNKGLRLLLDTHQEEYCGIYSKWSGAGFDVLIHDFDRPQSSFNYASLSLSPGYHTNVIIKQSTFDRKTEFLNLCKSKMDLFIFPHHIKYYFDQMCYIQCVAEMVWTHCNCFIYKIESMKKLAMKHHGVRNMSLCTVSGLQCAKKLFARSSSTINLAHFCGCKPACFENTYQYAVSMTVYPPKYTLNLAEDYDYSDYQSARKNAALVSFNFESKIVQIVTETQLFTITDLLTYIGSSFNLFLGWSVTTIMGVTLHLAFYLCVHCKRKFIAAWKKWKEKRIHPYTVTTKRMSTIIRKFSLMSNRVQPIRIIQEK